MSDQLEYRRLACGELRLFDGNPRRGNVDLIAKPLAAFGQYRPIVVNAGTLTGRPLEVLAGNHTLQAARVLGWGQIEAAVLDVDEERARQIVAADNRLSDLGEYDAKDLHELLSSLDDLDGTGYLDEDLAALERDLFPPEPRNDPDDAPAAPADPVSEAGQVWQLGEHRLLVGSATDLEAVAALCGDVQPDAVWTDPPYGVEYVGKTKDALRIQNDGAATLADLLGARCFAVELDPRYADVILRRFEAHTGIVPTLAGEPVSFVENVAA